MAIEDGGCQAVRSSIEDCPVLYGTGPTVDAQSPPSSHYCEGDSSEPLTDGVAELALLSPPSSDAHSQCGVLSSSSDEHSQSPKSFTESFDDSAVESPIVIAEADELNTLESCCDEVAVETTTTPSLMCNNSAGPAVAAASSPSLGCHEVLQLGDDDDTIPFPWSPSLEASPELKINMFKEPLPVVSRVGTMKQEHVSDAEEDHSETPAEETVKCTKEVAAEETDQESRALETDIAWVDMESDRQSIADSDQMEISFTSTFLQENVSECGDLDISAEGTFAVLEQLESEAEMEDDITVATTAAPESRVAEAGSATSPSTADTCPASGDNTCELDTSDKCSNTESEEGDHTTVMPPKITAAIVVQSNSSYMGNSSSDDDDDEELESSDCESLLGRDSPSPPGVDDSSLFPSVEEVETRTGISFESSGPSCSAPSFGSVAGMGGSNPCFSSSNQADTRRKAITLIDHHFRQIIDVERDLRRYVLHKTNLNRLYQEVREEKLNSHRRQKNGSSHHHHHSHQHQQLAAQSNTNNLPSPSFLSNPSVTPRTPRPSSPMPFGDSSHVNPPSYNRSGGPFAMAGEAGSAGNSGFCRQAPYGGQQGCGGQRSDCQEALLEPPSKRARLSCPAEEDKENKFSSAPTSASVFGSGGHSYTPPAPGTEYYHQVGCSSVAGTPSSTCSGDVNTTAATTTTHYSSGNSNGYYQSQASSTYGAYYNNNNYYANNMSYTPSGQFLGTFGSSSSESNVTGNHSSSSNSSSNGSYSIDTGTDEANAYTNVRNNSCNNVNSLDRGLSGFNASLNGSSPTDTLVYRSNNDIILEHIDEEIRRNSVNSRPASCPPSFSSSSSLFTFPSSSYFSQSLSSSHSSSASSSSLYNNGNNSLQYNNHFSNGGGWNTSYAYGSSSGSGSPHSPPSQPQQLQPYPCGRSSLMRGGNDFTSVVYSSLIASLET